MASVLRKPAVLLGLALLVLASLMSLLGRLSAPSEPKVRALSLDPGAESYPALSPDGKQVVYSGRAPGNTDTFDLFVRPVAGGAPRQLTRGDASDIAASWSPDGSSIAFARVEGSGVQYVVIPAAGNGEKKIAEFGGFSDALQSAGVAWTRDAKSLAVVGKTGAAAPAIMLVPAVGGEPKPITTPPEGSEGDTAPAISPDGSTVALVRRAGPEAGDIWACDLSGAGLRRVTFDEHLIHGLAWTANGREIVFSSNRAPGWRLWRVPAGGGSPREIQLAGRKAQYPAMARNSGRLVYSDSPTVSAIWRAELGKANTERSLIRSAGRESAPSYSHDGKRIAYVSDQSGLEEIWVADADGGNPAQVTSFKGPQLGRPSWSPDGRTLALQVRPLGPPEIHTAPVAGGPSHRIVGNGAGNPSWSRNGKWIYYGQRQVWRIPPEGGKPEALTRRGGSNPVESVDGKWVYYHRAREIWRIPAAGGEEEMFYEPGHNLFWGSLIPAKKGLYFMEWDFRARTVEIKVVDFEEKEEKTLFTLNRSDFDRGASFDLSPDLKYIVYPRTDQTETNLMVVEGFR
jgi:Tol biopolymer transport system component